MATETLLTIGGSNLWGPSKGATPMSFEALLNDLGHRGHDHKVKVGSWVHSIKSHQPQEQQGFLDIKPQE